MPARRHRAELEENLIEGLRVVALPAMEGVNQSITVDEVVLKGQQPKEEVAIT